MKNVVIALKYVALILLLVAPAFCDVKVGESAPPLRLQALIPNQFRARC